MTIQDLLRRFALIVTLILLGTGIARAQGGTGNGNEFDFSDIPVDDETPPYIGVGGGYIGTYSFIKLDELNGIAEQLNVPDFKGGLWMNGGGGFTAIGLVPNLRLGVYGMGGSKYKSQNVTIGSTEYSRTIRFSTGLTVAHVDYAIPLFRAFTLLPGLMLGAGSHTLEVGQTRMPEESFGNLVNPSRFGGDSVFGDNQFVRISRSYFALTPTVNFEYAVTQFFMLRLGATYAVTLAPSDWTDGGDIVIKDVPNVSANGLAVNIGLFVGLFQQ